MLSIGMEIAIRAKIPSIEKISIIPHSYSDVIYKSTTKTRALRYLKWRQSAFKFKRNRQTIKEIK